MDYEDEYSGWRSPTVSDDNESMSVGRASIVGRAKRRLVNVRFYETSGSKLHFRSIDYRGDLICLQHFS